MRRFAFQQDNNPKHTAKTTQEWLRDKFVNVLEWPSQSPDLNPIEHLWRDLKIAVQRHPPSNLTELERLSREEWEKLSKYRCVNTGPPNRKPHFKIVLITQTEICSSQPQRTTLTYTLTR